MRNYEIIFIVRPDVTDEDVDKLIAQMEGVVAGDGRQARKSGKDGPPPACLPGQKQREGFYVLFRLQGSGDTVKEFERRLKVIDTVIKYLTVRIDEDLERAEKFKALRAKQESKKRRSKPAVARRLHSRQRKHPKR